MRISKRYYQNNICSWVDVKGIKYTDNEVRLRNKIQKLKQQYQTLYLQHLLNWVGVFV